MSELWSESGLHSLVSLKARSSYLLFKFTMIGKEFNYSNTIILILSILMILKPISITHLIISSINLHLIMSTTMKLNKVISIIPLLDYRYALLCKAIMLQSSHMGRLEQARPTQWKDLNTIYMMRKEE